MLTLTLHVHGQTSSSRGSSCAALPHRIHWLVQRRILDMGVLREGCREYAVLKVTGAPPRRGSCA